ncbi:hypothetical protein [Rhodovulum sp. MB263]|nr:hypothetical protein [Rhodovulum sp. MB263]
MASATSQTQSSRPAAPKEPARDVSASRPAPADSYRFKDWASI